MSEISFTPQGHVKRCALRANDGTRLGVVADALTTGEPCVSRRDLEGLRGCCLEVLMGNRVAGLAACVWNKNLWVFHRETPKFILSQGYCCVGPLPIRRASGRRGPTGMYS